MSESSHTPWPVWAGVTILAALIGAWAVQKKNDQDSAKTPAYVIGVHELQPAPSGAVQMRAIPSGGIIPASATSFTETNSMPISFTIHDTIGWAQTEESVRFLIDGAYVGTLQISRERPSATLRATVSAPGRYSWSASSTAIFLKDDGQAFPYSGSGQGIINIEKDSSFDIRSTYSGPTWTIDVERDDNAVLR